MIRRTRRRKGAAALEFAVVAPIMILSVIAFLVLGLAVSDYQRIATAARDAARWASVRGMEYQRQTGNLAATATDVYDKAIVPTLAGMDMSRVTYSVTWDASREPYKTVVDNAGNVSRVQNTVTVTIQYQWNSDLFGNRTMSSTSTVPMTF